VAGPPLSPTHFEAMTAIRPNLLKLLVPLAAFACALAVLLATRSDVDLSGGTAGLDAAAYASLGESHLQKARVSGDPADYSRAERSFAAALRRDGRNVDALLGAGTLAGLRHDFAEQLRLGIRARRVAPELVAPLPVIADAQIELGRYGAAERTVQRLLDSKPNLTSYARVSYLRELNGDLQGAVQAMRLAASAGAGAAENVAYVQVLLGDLELQRGRIAAARLAYRPALRSLPGYPAGLVGLARADAAGGDLGRAAARLRRAAGRLPLPTTLTLLAEMERALGHPTRAGDALAGARAERRLYRAAATAPDAETVLFEADFADPGAAVELGQRVWRRAPSVRSADALGWALTRSGRPCAGLSWARRALRLGSRDALFRYHAGIAAHAAGRPFARDLRVAVRGGAMLSPRQLTQAKEALR
jgi:tetratricopeptide (TPR) repeat protein